MYTDTSRPNHLAQEVIDNAIDEAIAGFAKRIDVIYHTDGSLEVSDDGRGMPTDMHSGEKMTGVEVIMTKLQIPNHNTQIPNNIKIPTTNDQNISITYWMSRGHSVCFEF